MDTFYFKKIFVLFVLSMSVGAQEGAVSNKAGSDGTFIDKDGDTVTILDSEARAKLNAAKSIKATSVYDNESDIEKFKADYEKQILENRNIKYGEYVVVQGDTLKGISQKIYGSTKKWSEIQVINEEKLRNTTIKTGMKLKYIIYEKESQNGGKDTDKKAGDGSNPS